MRGPLSLLVAALVPALCPALAMAPPVAPPKTLFELAGARPEAGRLSNSVLVIIDAQREYLDGVLPLVGVRESAAEIASLLARARKAGTPVVHVVHRGQGGAFRPGSPGFGILPELKPLPGEAVVEKTKVSAFAGTDLEEVLRATKRDRLVVVGYMTHNCVSSTVRAAMDRGFLPTVPASATATRDLPDGLGGTLRAADLQRASLAALADRSAVVVPNATDILD